MIRIITPVPFRVYQQGFPAVFTFISDGMPSSCKVTVKDKNDAEVYRNDSVALHLEGIYFTGELTLPAGGWYKLIVETEAGTDTTEPFGVGEVFVIAGQSHATNSNNKQFRVEDKEGRITVYDPAYGVWRIGHDRQPCFDSSEYNAKFGTFWPVAFDSLIKKINVPIGMVNSAYGATALFQWMPGHEFGMFDRLVRCCKAVGHFRAVLWQQGESDVMYHTETDAYVSGMIAMKNALDENLGFKTEFIVAKSTIHPSVYTDPENEKKIRDADDILWNTDGFNVGPDTDLVNGDCRDRGQISGHMTEKGQLKAGGMWSDILEKYLLEKK